jgi:DNA-binding NarL/FixJ family response regulator
MTTMPTVHVEPRGRVESQCLGAALRSAGLPTAPGGGPKPGDVIVLLALDPQATAEQVQSLRGRVGEEVPILLLAHREDLAAVRLARGGVVWAVAPISAPTEVLAGTVRRMVGGSSPATVAHPEVHAAIPGTLLTRRELQVAAMLAGGWRNEEIAGELQISGHTVRTHVARVLEKLQVQHRLALRVKLPPGVTIPRPRRPVAEMGPPLQGGSP